MTQGLIGGIYASLTRANSRPAQQSLVDQVRSKMHVVKSYIRSYRWARQNAALFQEVQNYCLFVGHARSGGSLVGGLIDAHPNAVIADEVDIFPYLTAGFTREQIFHILLERSQHQARLGRAKAGRDQKQYSYMVPGQWQGKYQSLQVIGNRKAGISTQHLRQNPELYGRLQGLLGESIQIKTIFSVRNPFDTVSTMYIRSKRSLPEGINMYFANCETIDRLRKQVPASDFLALRHEDLLADPETHLRQTCSFLGIPALPEYLHACAGILYKAPSFSRKKVQWTDDLIQQVLARVAQFDFLHGYTFEN